jgi:hypothetical protein
MSATAWRLHVENVDLRQQIKQLEKKKRIPLPKPPRCVYCGDACHRGKRVCRAHLDLPAIDPGYHG